jgi:hypothetical protein
MLKLNATAVTKLGRKVAGFALAALALAGAFAFTPSAAKANPGQPTVQQQASQDLTNVTWEADLTLLNPLYWGKAGTANNDLNLAQAAFNSGDYNAEINDLNAVIKLLNLGQSLPQFSSTAPEPSGLILLAAGLLGLGLVARRRVNA